MLFNFDKFDEELIKILFEKEEPNVIISGSYALYKIHYKNELNVDKNNIEIKDLDFDLNNLIKEFSKTQNEEIKNTINDIIDAKISNKMGKLNMFENIDEYRINIIWKTLQERKYNHNTIGLEVELVIYDSNDKKYLFTFDLNFENKEFEILKKQVEIDNKKYNLFVYNENKIYSDKIIALIKRFQILNDILNKNENGAELEQIKRNNFKKIGKDLFDLKVIKQNSKINRLEIVENISKILNLNDKTWIINNLDFFQNLLNKYQNILINRVQRNDFTQDLNSYKKMFMLKGHELNL